MRAPAAIALVSLLVACGGAHTASTSAPTPARAPADAPPRYVAGSNRYRVESNSRYVQEVMGNSSEVTLGQSMLFTAALAMDSGRIAMSATVESLTISLINSYVDGRHEQELADLVEELYPGFPVTMSSAVLPEFREYERTLTACMNSYVRPQVARYVDSLLRGMTPADLPVQEIPTVEFAINLKTANRLGIKVPQGMIIRPDEVYR